MRLPELFRHIPDSELPHLEAYKKRSALALSVILLGVETLAVSAQTLRGMIYPWRAATTLLVDCLLTLLAYRVSRRATWKSDFAVLAASFELLHNLTSISWNEIIPRNDFLPALMMSPLIVACFIPARPAYSVVMGWAAMGATLLCAKNGVRPAGPVGSFMFSTFVNSLIGALAMQMQRRLWHKFETARAQLAAADRMSVLGRMSAGIAHEMKTPLAAAMNGLESTRALAAELAESIGHPDVEHADLAAIAREISESVAGATSATTRAARFITAIRSQTLAMTSVDSAPFSVASAIANTLTLVEHARRGAGITIDTSGVAAGLNAVSDESKLSQVVVNLVCNALDACAAGRGSRVRVSAKLTATGGDRILLVVEDDGPGVLEAHRDRIFDALFTTKRDSEGTGLGLAISRDIAEGALGGHLVLARSERGARFELEFPRYNGRQAAPGRPTPSWSPAKAA